MKNTLSKTKPSAAKAKSSAARLQRARDRRLIVCMSLTSAVGLCVLLLGCFAVGVRAEDFLSVGLVAFVYIACSALSIVDLYFHYSLCRWHNRWHRAFHEEGGSEGEPSAFALVASKISGWFLFIFMQLTAFVPVIFSALLYL